jgi:hypothetical protein
MFKCKEEIMGPKLTRSILVISVLLIAWFIPSWKGYSLDEYSLNEIEWGQSNPLAVLDEVKELTPTPKPDDVENDIPGLPEGWPEDAYSTTGPKPPEDLALERSIAEVVEGVILDVPAYTWWRGCGPTAGGMVIGYWDGQGFDDLVQGSAETQTDEVNAMISSQGNWDDYCLPLDAPPDPILPDKSEPPEGDEHPDDSVADFMKTSQSASRLYFGSTWSSDLDDGIEAYVRSISPDYYVSAKNRYWGGLFTWDDFRNEIDEGRPVNLMVDSNADGTADHFIAAIGYSTGESPPMYAAYNTWDREIHWYEFAPMASGRPFGIYGATLVNIAATPIVPNDEFDFATVIESLPYADQVYTEDASTAPDDPVIPCIDTPGQEYYTIWYRYTPSEDQEIKIDTFGTRRNSILAVWTGTRGNLTNVACNDNAWVGTSDSKVVLAVSEGETYHIEVAAHTIWMYGTNHIHVSLNIDTEPPETILVSHPPDITTEDSATFHFIGTDDINVPDELVFECRLDQEDFSLCIRPKTYSSLADGTHIFEVRAIDQSGKVDPTPASHTWIIDTIPPITTAMVSGENKGMCPNDCYFGEATVTLSASDSGSGVGITRYRILFADGADSSWLRYSEPFVITTEGVNTVEFYSRDYARNYEETKSISVKVTSFPSTDVLDDFNRRDGPLGFPWLGARWVFGYRIDDQQVDVVRGGPLIWWHSYGADQEAFFTFERVDQHAPIQGLLLKIQSFARSGVQGIMVNYTNGEITVGTYGRRSGLNIYDRFPVTLSDGDHLGAKAMSDGTVVVYVNCLPIGEVGTGMTQKGGRIGLLFFGARNAIFDDFGGGDRE